MTQLHEILLETKSLLHVSATGAGPTLQKEVWSTPGCSAYFIGCFIPYRRTQLHSFLGHEPDDSYVDLSVAIDMASASYMRASEAKVVENIDGHPVGLGITAAVASNRMPHGEHRAHIVAITKDRVVHRPVLLPKSEGREAREYHDALIATAALKLLTDALAGTDIEGCVEKEALERFYLYPIFHTNGTRRKASEAREREIYLPATLNPIHDGHRTMCRAAEDTFSPAAGRVKASYLVSSVSPHKGRLSVQDMLFKAGMLRAERWKKESRMVEFTHDEPLFLDKARKRPGSVFLIGADTMQRMLDPKWGPDIPAMLLELKNLGVKFLVMDRLVDDKLLTCRNVPVPWPHGDLFDPLAGRVDISSSELRTPKAP
jgi:nicotinic acid mononucleotide adenylyltransferase